MHRGVKLGAMLALGAGLTPAALVAQATTGTIAGRITDAASGRPIPAAQIQIVGTTRGASTSDEGTFRLVGVPAGTYQVRVLRLGFTAVTRQVVVRGGQSATLDASLAATAVALDQVVVTATGEQVRRREQGNVTATITPSVNELAATANITDVLNSRSPGVYVQQSSGNTGTGSRIRIRGANSLSLSNEPLLVVDGIRANSDQGTRTGGTNVGTGGQTTSRLNDINPEDIESIEVIKGPAGVALYGTAAANGVIQVTTKKGRAGNTQWNVYSEGGDLDQTVDLPGNYGNIGTVAAGANAGRATQCTNEARSRGVCNQGTLKVLFPATVENPFRGGERFASGVSARGGNERIRFFTSADYQNERGVQLNNADRRYNLRGNFDTELRPGWTLAVNSGYLMDRLSLPVNDNSTLGLLSTALLGRAASADSLSGGFFNRFTPTQLRNLAINQDIDRFTSSATTNYQFNRWLSFTGVAGLDLVSQRQRQVILPNRVFFGDLNQGSANSNPLNIYNWTSQGNFTANFDLTPSLTSQTLVGAQYTRELFRGTNAFSAQLAGGTGSVSGGTARFAVSEFNTDNVIVGAFVQQRFGWRDRVFLSAALRADRNSAAGRNFGLVYLPNASLSYVISEEGWFPKSKALSSLRLFASAGASTQRPTFTDALTFLSPFAVRANDAESAAISFAGGSIGDPALRPEKTTEYEGGAELAFIDGRVTAQVNYYQKRTNDLLIAVPVAPSVGAATSRFQNIGAMRNRGWEFLVNAELLNTRPVRVDFGFGGNTLDNLLLSTNLPSPIQVTTQQQHRAGSPAGAFFQRKYTYADANNDGLISRTEITFPAAAADTAAYLGNPLPKLELQFTPAITLYRNVRLSALISHRGGFKVNNATNRFRCAFSQNCFDVNSPTAPLDLQARAVAAANFGTDAGYIEDGDFTRLREVALSVTAPRDLLARRGVSRLQGLTFTLAGRNLATWTNYTGLDPEVTSTPGANFASSEFLTVPPVRQIIARITATF